MPSIDINEPDLLAAISRQWETTFVRLRPDLPLAGSPERTAWRSVVEADDGRLFVLEKIPSRVYGRKRRIAAVLRKLFDLGMHQIIPCQPDIEGEVIPLINHSLWQMCIYIDGVNLDRPAYTGQGWRGDAAAAFLTELAGICGSHTISMDAAPFSIVIYSRDLFGILSQRQPQIAAQYQPFMDHLETHLTPVHDRLPQRFCHGDFHPLNIIWGKQRVRAVIDWEFCGLKPEIYDLANLLGCLGMEAPSSLAGSFVRRLIRRTQKVGIFSPESWKILPDLILAIRFAWLSEWLRKNDQPMIRLEADYMALLVRRRPELIAFFLHTH